jgi:hypothetical protein
MAGQPEERPTHSAGLLLLQRNNRQNKRIQYGDNRNKNKDKVQRLSNWIISSDAEPGIRHNITGHTTSMYANTKEVPTDGGEPC